MITKESMIEDYRKSLEQFGPDDFRSMLWSSADGRSTRCRYEQMAKHVGSFRDRSVIELGCGLGSFFRLGHSCKSWVGIDLVPEFVMETNKLIDKLGLTGFAKAVLGDLDKVQTLPKADVFISSGVTADRGAGFWDRSKLRTLFETALSVSSVAIFTFPSALATIRTERIEYFDPESVLAIALQCTDRVVLKHGYLKGDFMLVLGE